MMVDRTLVAIAVGVPLLVVIILIWLTVSGLKKRGIVNTGK
jgi:hypothetical protein